MTIGLIEKKAFRTFTKPLPCILTDRELLQRGGQLAEAVQDAESEEERQKSLKTEMKARLDELAARKTRLSLTISRKEEYRDVEVDCILQDNGLAQEVRTDTGEVLRVRPLADEEKQLTL